MTDKTALVIGASMAGLLAARILTGHFERVLVIDRDTLPDGPDVRGGVPQGKHVHALLSACLDAYRATHELHWYHTADQAFEWFLGRNALGLPVYDEESGGCSDGLHIDRLNENQGAESTLAFIQSMIEMDQFRAETAMQTSNTDPRVSRQSLVTSASNVR